jgi:flagellar hook protein FlgE
MGIFDALTTAVSGLQAQSFALQNISGNIANSQTVGYKETDTSFQDLVSAAAQNQQTSGGVFASSVSTNSVQGTIQSTSVLTDMAINGDGYFVVAQPTGQTDTPAPAPFPVRGRRAAAPAGRPWRRPPAPRLRRSLSES